MKIIILSLISLLSYIFLSIIISYLLHIFNKNEYEINIYHLSLEKFPFQDRTDHKIYRLSIYFNVLKKIMLGGNIKISYWYLSFNINLLVFNLQFRFIFNKNGLVD